MLFYVYLDTPDLFKDLKYFYMINASLDRGPIYAGNICLRLFLLSVDIAEG